MLGFETVGSLDVSIGGMDILLFLNSLDMFTKSILVLLSLLQLWK